ARKENKWLRLGAVREVFDFGNKQQMIAGGMDVHHAGHDVREAVVQQWRARVVMETSIGAGFRSVGEMRAQFPLLLGKDVDAEAAAHPHMFDETGRLANRN